MPCLAPKAMAKRRQHKKRNGGRGRELCYRLSMGSPPRSVPWGWARSLWESSWRCPSTCQGRGRAGQQQRTDAVRPVQEDIKIRLSGGVSRGRPGVYAGLGVLRMHGSGCACPQTPEKAVSER